MDALSLFNQVRADWMPVVRRCLALGLIGVSVGLTAVSASGCMSSDGSGAAVEAWAGKVIFGDDNRAELGAGSAFDHFASSVVAVVLFPSLAGCTGHRCDLHTVPHGTPALLCPDERFFGEPTAPICTGFLVANNVVATAGHCVANQQECEQLAFVFGFASDSADTFKTTDLETYTCAKLLAQSTGDDDYALIQLDRPAGNHPVLPLNTGAPVQDAELVTLGHPSGLPLKVVDGGKILGMEDTKLMYNVDSTHGNSGGPIINTTTGAVEGIIVVGPRSYELDTSGMCYRERRCDAESCDESLPAYGQSARLSAGATPAALVAEVLSNVSINCQNESGGQQ